MAVCRRSLVIVVRSRRSFLVIPQLILLACVVGAAFGGVCVSCAAYLPVYGSPPFIQGVGGYKALSTEEPVDTATYRIAVNNNGIAVSSVERSNATGNRLDIRAVRWSATEAIELENLGTDFEGIATTGAFDINNAGTTVGGAAIGSGFFGRPVRWSIESTAATELANLSVTIGSWPEAINDAGTSVGSYFGLRPGWPGWRAVLWSAPGTDATTLGNASGFDYSKATEINNAGTIIGSTTSRSSSSNHAVRWDTPNNAATLLGHLGPDVPGSTTTATAINDAGVIAGTSSKHDTSGNLLGTFAVRWDAGGIAATELQNPNVDPATGQSEAHVTAINADGTIVGYAKQYPGSKTAALRWDPGETSPTILGSLGISPSYYPGNAAIAINASGIAVGFSETSAVYWRTDGIAVDLNTLIDPNSGWVLRVATAISDTGWIAGHGWFDPDGPGGQQSYPRMFLLQIPEPTSLLFFGLGLVHLLLIRRRRE